MGDINFLLESSNLGQQLLRHTSYDIAFWFLIGLNLVFIALAKSSTPNYIKVLFTTAIINRHLMQSVQEDLKISSRSSILLTLTYFNSIAIIIAYLAFGSYGSGSLLFLAIIIGLALLKWATVSFISFVSQTKVGILEHTYNHFVFYQIGGLVITPILVFTHFFSAEMQLLAMITCAVIVALLIIIREFQSLQRAIKSRVHGLYIILYLCTLEILPLVLFIYAFVSELGGLN